MFRLLFIFLFSVILFSSCEKEILADDRGKANRLLKKEFSKRFGIEVEHLPLIYSNNWEHWTSTIYYNETLYRLYLKPDGEVSGKIFQMEQLPKSEQTVLVVMVKYKALDIENNIMLWEEAQQKINDEHKAYAMSQGYNAPIVQFQNTNILVDSGAIKEPRLENIKWEVNKQGVDIKDYDIIALVDLNAAEPSGGFGDYQLKFVKIGWFYGNIANQTDELDRDKMKGIANAVYHHEIGHVWGWEHKWSDADNTDFFITEPVLFGWEDMDSDGIPEILDENPYGIK